MTTAAKRIHELTTRQIYTGSSMIVKLNSVNGHFHYKVILTKSLDEQVKGEYRFSKIILEKGKYNGEDPEELLKQSESKYGKWKCGRLVNKNSWGLAK